MNARRPVVRTVNCVVVVIVVVVVHHPAAPVDLYVWNGVGDDRQSSCSFAVHRIIVLIRRRAQLTEPTAVRPVHLHIDQSISETADSKIEIHDNDNVQLIIEVRKGCCQR